MTTPPHHPRPTAHRPPPPAFTLVELLVTLAVLSLLMTMVAEVISRTQKVVTQARSRAEEFQEARAAFEALTSALSQASMDATWAYHMGSNINNSYFKRESDLHFVLGSNSDLLAGNTEVSQAVFFQAPLGFTGTSTGATGPLPQNLDRAHEMLNCWGYFIEFGSDLNQRPSFLQTSSATTLNPERYRFRLMEFRLPAEQSVLYSIGLNSLTSTTLGYRWFRGPFQDNSTLAAHATPVAENVLAMILVPYSITTQAQLIGDTSAQFIPETDYRYDSRLFQWTPGNAKAARTRHQLPAMVQINLIVTDEPSYQRFEDSLGSPTAAASRLRTVFAGRFQDHSRHASDMSAVESQLNLLKLNYKILSTNVAMRGAKWITDQEMP